ncbi:MAG: ankyrin repeat domain-containing protein [Acidobacteriota bacterium]|nr:ankyrin repeat domain-containing protein [Acidobacteriota bacterium]
MSTRKPTTVALMGLLTVLAGCRDVPDTPLTAAAAAGRIAEIETLLAAGADVDDRDDNDLTPLAWAARHGRLHTIRVLLDHGADPDLPAGGNDWPPLVHAVHKGADLCVIELLDAGADIEGSGGRRALLMAAGYGNAEIVREMLGRGADPHIDGILTDAVAGAWDIDYQWSGCEPHTETVRALLEAAPDLELEDDFFGRRALSKARKRGCTELVELVGSEEPRDQAARLD